MKTIEAYVERIGNVGNLLAGWAFLAVLVLSVASWLAGLPSFALYVALGVSLLVNAWFVGRELLRRRAARDAAREAETAAARAAAAPPPPDPPSWFAARGDLRSLTIGDSDLDERATAAVGLARSALGPDAAVWFYTFQMITSPNYRPHMNIYFHARSDLGRKSATIQCYGHGRPALTDLQSLATAAITARHDDSRLRPWTVDVAWRELLAQSAVAMAPFTGHAYMSPRWTTDGALIWNVSYEPELDGVKQRTVDFSFDDGKLTRRDG